MIAKPETIRQSIQCQIDAIKQPRGTKQFLVSISNSSTDRQTVEDYDNECRQRIAVMEALLWKV